MLIIKKSLTNNLTPTPSTTIREYPMDEQAISGAVSKINGRYPKNGFAVNEISKELVYIIEGKGKIITKDGEREFDQGDVIFIDRGELFAWEGNFTMFMTTTPKFDPIQHNIVLQKIV